MNQLLKLPAYSVFLLFSLNIAASDWPQWRYDAGRSASTPHALPDNLELSWERSFPQREQVWDDPLNHDLMPYDRIFEPIVSKGLMILNFNDSDKVLALSIHTGQEVWRFYTDGPVRFPAVANGDHTYVVSDDGSLYCLNTRTGELTWSFRGAPGGLKVIGNERVISAWPARGGPVLRDGTIYFAASIWPFMGTFIYALDAQTGHIQWVNDSTSAQYIKQPHNAPSFAGVAPQGAFVATENDVIVPGGRSVPAVFDRQTGDFKYFHLAAGGKGNGGSFVTANEQHFFAHTRVRGVRAYDLAKGGKTDHLMNEPVLDGDLIYASYDESIYNARVEQLEAKLESANKSKTKGEKNLLTAPKEEDIRKACEDITKAEKTIAEITAKLDIIKGPHTNGWQNNRIEAFDGNFNQQWELEADASGDLIKSGTRLYAAGKNSVTAYELSSDATIPPNLIWSQQVEGNIQRLLAAGDMLFGVTLEGNILAFGATSPRQNKTTIATNNEPILKKDPWPGFETMVKGLNSKAGYALCYGLKDVRALDALLMHTDFHIAGVDPDPERIDTLRHQYDADASFYGNRIALHQGDPTTFQAPAYFASLVLINGIDADILNSEWIDAAYHSVRPYGGQCWIIQKKGSITKIESMIEAASLENAIVDNQSLIHDTQQNHLQTSKSPSGTLTRITREGALPGSADWTHQYGDVANTVKSDDRRVKLPLGLLWFGGSSNMDVLPRHGHGPPEQVIGGRTIIEGMDSLSARDVYTGRVIWKRNIQNLDTYGIYYNETYEDVPLSTIYNQVHLPGANGRGSNYVATEDAVYVALEDYCEVLDAESGKSIRHINLPPKDGGAVRPRWGYIGVYEDILLGGHDFAHFSKKAFMAWKNDYAPIEDLSASDGLVAFDRHTGKELWKVEPRHSFIHNGIVAGNGRVYCLDKLPKSAEGKMSRRGMVRPDTYRIIALDALTGEQIWESTGDIFGTWLSYSEKYDVLLQAGADASDRLPDEVGTGLVAYSGKTGEIIWKNLEQNYTGPCIIHNDLVLTTPNSYKDSAGAFRLLDGKPHWVVNPLTQQEEPLLFSRAYGCNTPVASEHIITFRSGAAGYFDLAGNSGTGNLGGFRSSCTSNLVIANGVLNAPDYTRTCSCGYQNQTSLALIHMPDVEMWTFSKLGINANDGETIQQAGINLGAPGDRRAGNGTLWLEFPVVGGDSPEIPVTVVGEKATYYMHHSARFTGNDLTWVSSSGVEHAEKIILHPYLKNPTTEASEDQIKTDVQLPLPAEEQQASIYTLRLHFAEPKKLKEGDRTFNVYLQDQLVLENLDIMKETGTYQKTLVKEFKQIPVVEALEIKLTNPQNQEHGTILSGIELMAE